MFDNNTVAREYRRNTSVDSNVEMSGYECSDTFEGFVYLAGKEDRLTTGIFESAHILEMCPEVVDICILPSDKGQNSSTLIQHKLIQAYCWENDIQILELDQAEFSQATKMHRSKSTESTPIECFLISSKPVNELEIDDFDYNGFDENVG